MPAALAPIGVEKKGWCYVGADKTTDRKRFHLRLGKAEEGRMHSRRRTARVLEVP